jgi:release factor glutamine methyltransferase
VNVLDLCAGSGAIGVAVAKAIPDSVVTFAELDPKHLPTIEKNITLNLTQPDSNHTINRMIRLGGQTILSGDLFENISPTTQFDFILTNPPYIDAKANTVELNVTEHEPHLALFGGAKGMEIIARIIAESPQFLTSGGQLWIEHEPFQSAVILEQALSTGYSTVITHPDQYGVPRFSILSMAQ